MYLSSEDTQTANEYLLNAGKPDLVELGFRHKLNGYWFIFLKRKSIMGSDYYLLYSPPTYHIKAFAGKERTFNTIALTARTLFYAMCFNLCVPK